MAKTKSQQTTRDTKFNYIINDNSVTSLISYNATKTVKNITLLGVEDGISITGKQIFDHAADNRTLKDFDVSIDVNSDVKDEDAKIINNTNNHYKIYGAPFKEVLNNKQHYNNCGVESTLNTLASAGIIKMKENLSDQKSVEKNFLKTAWEMNLVDDDGVIGKLDTNDGGTLPDDYKAILKQFGIESEAYYITSKCDGTQYNDLNKLAYMISCGHGAVLGVCSDYLWQETGSESGEKQIDHAVAVVGVVYKEDTNPAEKDDDGNYKNSPLGFYIHDSGGWMTRYISFAEFQKVTLYNQHGMKWEDYEKYADYDEEHALTKDEFEALYKPNLYNEKLRDLDPETRLYIGKKPNGIAITITTDRIKSDIFNLNATGDKYANVLTGNSGDNTLKGMAGNDKLYGNAGDDEIRGGAGNDIIVGNNVSEADLNEFKGYINTIDSSIASSLTNLTTSNDILTGSNLLYGDAGADVIIGGEDLDLIYGGAGNDYIWAGNGRNAAYGGAGNDLIIGGWDNDRLFGDAGDDIIYGWGDNDTIHGGAGNDTILGGRGNDRIETGKGNDVVYFEGQEHGVDKVSSEGGHTTFMFTDAEYENGSGSEGYKISDMVNISMEKDESNSKIMNLGIAYTYDENNANDGVQFLNFFSTKTGKSKGLAIYDADGELYSVTATKSKKATVSNTRMIGTTTIGGKKGIKNEDVNNILLTTNEKGTTITTSDKADIVVMVGTDDKSNTYYKDATVYDSVTYKGGNDIYVSEERNTRYYVENFSDLTNLTIRDNIQALEKVKVNELGLPTSLTDPEIDKTVVSTDDRLYINSEKTNLHFLFDVKLDGTSAITTENNGLFLLNKNNNDNFAEVVKSITGTEAEDADCGCVYMESFFGYDKDNKTVFDKEKLDFFGNGQIEKLYYKQDDSNPSVEYEKFNYDLAAIAGEVAKWLSNGSYNTGSYDTAFKAFNHFDELSSVAKTALVNAYTIPSIPS